MIIKFKSITLPNAFKILTSQFVYHFVEEIVGHMKGRGKKHINGQRKNLFLYFILVIGFFEMKT